MRGGSGCSPCASDAHTNRGDADLIRAGEIALPTVAGPRAINAGGRRYPAIVRPLGAVLGGVRTVPNLRCRDSHRRLQQQRDRKCERPHPADGAGPRAPPYRGRRPQMRLPRCDEPGPDRPRQMPVDHAVETSPQRLRHRFRRTHIRRPQVNINQPRAHRSLDSSRQIREPNTYVSFSGRRGCYAAHREIAACIP